MSGKTDRERIKEYMEAFNQKRDYIECHHISRDMLMDGNDKKLAKCLATLSALVEQAEKKKWTGYKKLYKKFFEQLDAIDHFPFDEEDVRKQLQHLDEQINQDPEQSIDPIYLKT